MVLSSFQHASGNDLCSLNTEQLLLLTRLVEADVIVVVQASLRRNPAPDPRRDPSSVGSQLGALKFETGQKALFLGRAYYGCVATILPPVTAGLTRKVCSPHLVAGVTCCCFQLVHKVMAAWLNWKFQLVHSIRTRWLRWKSYHQLKVKCRLYFFTNFEQQTLIQELPYLKLLPLSSLSAACSGGMLHIEMAAALR